MAPSISPSLTSAPAAIGAAVGACCVGLAVWNPGDHGIPFCPTKAVTGLDCPLCGGLRAVASLTRGHVAAAADHNLLVAVVAPFAVAWWLAAIVATRRGNPVRTPRWNRVSLSAFVFVVVAFTVVRNLRVGGRHNWLASEAY